MCLGMKNIDHIRFTYQKRNSIMLNLLLITKGKEQHCVLIKDFNKFMYNQTKHARRKHFCMHCLQCFKSKIVLNNIENCIIVNGVQAIKMPKADETVHFKTCHKGIAATLVIFANFETIYNETVHRCQPNNDKPYILNHIRSKKTVDMDIRLSVIMMISIVNQFKYIEKKMLFISSWQKC